MCGGSGIVVEHERQCEDGSGYYCPICSGNVSPEFIEWLDEVVAASEAQPGKVMTADEFNAWLDTL
jgi:hypothetical protein